MDFKVYDAIKSSTIDRLKSLINKNTNEGLLLQNTPHDNTSLHVAVQFGRSVAILEEICKICPLSFLMHQNLEGDTPLHIAARLGSSRIVDFLINRAPKIMKDEGESGGGGGIESGEISGTNVAQGCSSSVSSSSLSKVQQLVRMPNKRKDTALHDAVVYGSYEVVKLLTEADPDFEYFPNDSGETPLYLAVKNDSYDVVDQILKKCPSSPHGAPGGRTVLHSAALYCKCKHKSSMIKLLVEKKQGILQDFDSQGRSALHYAVYSNYLPVVKQLLDVDHQSIAIRGDKDGMTFLHHMAALTNTKTIGSQGFIKEVIESCSEFCWELVDNKGQNFLHVAAENGRSDVIKSVLDIKSKMVTNLINRRDDYGNTPLQLALKFGKDDCSFILRWDDRLHSINATFQDEFTNYDNAQKTMRTQREKSQGLRSSHPNMERLLEEEVKRIQQQVTKNRELMQNISQTHMLVATLIATVAFAASFTLPGGYNSDGPNKGMATLVHQPTFILFIISNSFAMLLSTFAVFVHFWSKSFDIRDDENKFLRLVRITLGSTFCAIIAMVIAFVSGTNAVISHSPKLAMTVFIIGWCFILLAIILVNKILKWKGLYEHLGYLPISKLKCPPTSLVAAVTFDTSTKSV